MATLQTPEAILALKFCDAKLTRAVWEAAKTPVGTENVVRVEEAGESAILTA